MLKNYNCWFCNSINFRNFIRSRFTYIKWKKKIKKKKKFFTLKVSPYGLLSSRHNHCVVNKSKGEMPFIFDNSIPSPFENANFKLHICNLSTKLVRNKFFRKKKPQNANKLSCAKILPGNRQNCKKNTQKLKSKKHTKL